MATQIPGTVIASLATKLDSLDPSEQEHAALAVVLAAGLESGREPAEVEGFMPTAVELTSSAPLSSQLGTMEIENWSFTYRKIDVTYQDGGVSMSDSWSAPA